MYFKVYDNKMWGNKKGTGSEYFLKPLNMMTVFTTISSMLVKWMCPFLKAVLKSWDNSSRFYNSEVCTEQSFLWKHSKTTLSAGDFLLWTRQRTRTNSTHSYLNQCDQWDRLFTAKEGRTLIKVPFAVALNSRPCSNIYIFHPWK